MPQDFLNALMIRYDFNSFDKVKEAASDTWKNT